VPVVLQVQAAGDIPPGLLQPPVQLEKASPARFAWRRGKHKGEGLEAAKDFADILQLDRIERPHAKPSTEGRVQDAFPDQPQHRLSDGRAADT